MTLEDAATADELFSVLMGEDVEARRSFITRNAKDVRFLESEADPRPHHAAALTAGPGTGPEGSSSTVCTELSGDLNRDRNPEPRPRRAGRPPAGDAAQLHRLRDVGDRRPCAAGGARRPEAGAPARAVRHVRPGLPPRPRLREVRPRRRRGHGQLPPPRRHLDLRRPRAPGPALVDALPARRRAGQLRLAGQRPGRGHAVHRVPADPAGHGDAGQHRRGDRRLPARTTTARTRSRWSCRRASRTC